MGAPCDYPYRLTLSARHDQLSMLSAWLKDIAKQCGLSPQAAYAMELVLTEAVTNVMYHAGIASGEHPIQLACACGDSQVWLEMRDDGKAFDPTRQADHVQPASLEEAVPGGLGIALMRQYTSSMSYRREHGCNILSMSMPSTSEPPHDG